MPREVREMRPGLSAPAGPLCTPRPSLPTSTSSSASCRTGFAFPRGENLPPTPSPSLEGLPGQEERARRGLWPPQPGGEAGSQRPLLAHSGTAPPGPELLPCLLSYELQNVGPDPSLLGKRLPAGEARPPCETGHTSEERPLSTRHRGLPLLPPGG